MYPHFIEVHDNRNPQMEFMLNVDHINYFYVNEDGVTKIMLSGLRYEEISETYEELKDLIVRAGCHIEKGDPRLDQTKPLTMNDLKDMVGQPVWDSNTDTWLLVYEGDWTYTPDPDRVCVRVVNRYGCNKIWLSEKDLIAKPLYRMKRNEDRIYIPDGYTQAKTGSKNR